MMDLELDVLQCPRCGQRLTAANEQGLSCAHGHCFEVRSGVVTLLPELDPDDPRCEEESEFADGSPEAERTKRAPWLWITRFPQVRRFDTEVLPLFPVGRFVEIGGGSCYAAAMYKSTYPAAVVYATDVSSNTLRNKAKPVCSLFPRQPDYYVAAAAEALPFGAGTVDCMFGELFVHHSPDPSQILREAMRVLAPGGRLILHEPSVPPAFEWLFRRGASARETHLHIHEDLISLRRWEQYVRDSGMPPSAMKFNTSGAYQTNPLLAIAGIFLSRLPVSLAKRLFPVGLVIDYRKPEWAERPHERE